ncbi:hypothetical protein [Mesobacillus campisalis]|nr:hypothetical protein [Mesobacillus campisalis]
MELSKAIEVLRRERFTEEEVEHTVEILAETKGVDLHAVKHLLEDTRVS